MLKNLYLVNFQGHANSEFEFDPHVNVIVGDSDVGKTAVLRALWWLYSGNPNGDTVIRKKANTAKVTAVFDDVTVARERRATGKEKNVYTINDAVLKAFGQSVPQEILEKLNFRDLNFMRQMDAPFLLSMTPSETAEYLNQIIDLDVITETLNRANTYSRSVNAKIHEFQNTIENLTTKLSDYEWFDKGEKLVKAIVAKQDELENEKNVTNVIKGIVKNIQTLAVTAEKFDYLDAATKTVEELQATLKAFDGNKKAFDKLMQAVKAHKDLLQRAENNAFADKAQQDFIKIRDTYISYNKQKKEFDNLLSTLKAHSNETEKLKDEADITHVMDRVLHLIDLVNKNKNENVFVNDIRKLIQSWQEMTRLHNRLEQSLDKFEKEFSAKMPDVCPLCGRSMK